MTAHDTWVNRYMTVDGDVYYQAVCTCAGMDAPHHANPDDAHNDGIEHMVENAAPVPAHKIWVNMGMEFLDMNGARRLVYTPLCSCQWMGDRQADHETAYAMAEAHEANPVAPDGEGE